MNHSHVHVDEVTQFHRAEINFVMFLKATSFLLNINFVLTLSH